MVSRCSTYHSDLQCFAVELPDLPVAQDIAKDFHKSIDPEDGCHDEKEYNPAVLFNAEWKHKVLFRHCWLCLSEKVMALCHSDMGNYST